MLFSDPLCYRVISGAYVALEALISACQAGEELPDEVQDYIKHVAFSNTSPSGDMICFPCPLREQEAGAALKAVEGCATAALCDLRYGKQGRDINVNLERVTCFLMSAYVTTLDGLGKGHPKIKFRLPGPDTDLNEAQSILYRRLAANLYETRNPGEYYHIHGSLEASTTLRMLGLPPFLPGATDYRQCIDAIESAVKKFSVSELEQRNRKCRQAGAPALTKDQFRQTAHGRALAKLAPFTVRPLGTITPPVAFPAANAPQTAARQCLAGIRVLELCRVIAGPTIGRSLAAHGAQVIKVTSPKLPDVPFFQLDVNTGKHTTSLHLKDPADRAIFEDLLASADVFIDGYRPGVLASLGYSPESLAARAAQYSGRGIVYVTEDCFGGTGVAGAEWADRPGWQQIADCVTGVAWEQGWSMGLDEPVVPPFPISDYGTGILGTVAALTGLYRRATHGGSWICRTSLIQYNTFLLSLGAYPPVVQEQLWKRHDRDLLALRHSDSVDEVGARALRSIRRLHPDLFEEGMMQEAYSEGFGGVVRWPKEPLEVTGIKVGHVRPTRPNGFDPPSWDGWDKDKALLDA
ncbi:CoA-transferase family III [Pseudomassariella vexata]|uniref:CoA-transferase family III n=1 Tax=Pseudomassariella vexata TaxID=1141098 RepID=A0A1Y2EEI9_9PEZI|nr:CoA-transferase family III [Pseudomassariella vexata]ORY69827.1 CoA-transferase family III [Pseudomassariella vexata]